MRTGVVLCLLWLAACQLEIEHGLQRCGDLLCPTSAVCVDNRVCIDGEDARACMGVADGEPCSTSKVADGICGNGACVTPGCGNGFVESGEVCDDGNVSLGDGCSADCRSDESCGNGVLDFFEACDDGSVMSGDGCSSTCKAEHLQLVTVDRPGPSAVDVIAYMTAQQTLVVFNVDETWLYKAGVWTRGPAGPSLRMGTSMAYDANRQKLVLFGGLSTTTLADTWEFDGTSWTQNMTANGPPRRGHTLAYDPARQAIVMFGGRSTGSSTSLTNQVWSYSGTTWSLVTTTGTAPGVREAAGWTYDSSRSALVLVGGRGTSTTIYADMWTLSATNVWTPETTTLPTTSGPSLGYDAARAVLVLHLGGAVYETSTTTWNARTDTPTFGGPFDLAYDTAQSRMVVLGGTEFQHWEVAASWTRRASRPGTLENARLAFDLGGHRLLLRGGATNAETWARDATGAWSLVSSADIPQAPTGSAIVYDPVRRRLVAFGRNATVMETWELDGDTWTPLTPSDSPPLRDRASMVYDLAHERIVLFGGEEPNTLVSLDDTWVFAGGEWTELQAGARPEPRSYVPLAYDAVRQRVVLAGGTLSDYTPLADCWELDGDNWTDVESLPIRRGEGILAYDQRRHRTVLYGGWELGIGGDEDVIEFDGTVWSYAVSNPEPEFQAASIWSNDVTYDPIARAIVVIGVEGAGDEWALGYFSWTADEPLESCSGADDLDRDDKQGCADPDCVAYCDPVCPPGATCAATRPRCGDGTCDPTFETQARCAEDCP